MILGPWDRLHFLKIYGLGNNNYQTHIQTTTGFAWLTTVYVTQLLRDQSLGVNFLTYVGFLFPLYDWPASRNLVRAT